MTLFEQQLNGLQEAKLEQLSYASTLSLEEALSDLLFDEPLMNKEHSDAAMGAPEIADIYAMGVVNEGFEGMEGTELLDEAALDAEIAALTEELLQESVDMPMTQSEVNDMSVNNDWNKFQFYNQDYIPQYDDEELIQEFNPDTHDGIYLNGGTNEMNTVRGMTKDIPDVTSLVNYLTNDHASASNERLDSRVGNTALSESEELSEEDYLSQFEMDPDFLEEAMRGPTSPYFGGKGSSMTNGINPEDNFGDHLALGIQEFAYVSDPDRAIATNDIPEDFSYIAQSHKSIQYPPTQKDNADINKANSLYSGMNVNEMVDWLTSETALNENVDPSFDEGMEYGDDGIDGNYSLDDADCQDGDDEMCMSSDDNYLGENAEYEEDYEGEYDPDLDGEDSLEEGIDLEDIYNAELMDAGVVNEYDNHPDHFDLDNLYHR